LLINFFSLNRRSGRSNQLFFPSKSNSVNFLLFIEHYCCRDVVSTHHLHIILSNAWCIANAMRASGRIFLRERAFRFVLSWDESRFLINRWL